MYSDAGGTVKTDWLLRLGDFATEATKIGEALDKFFEGEQERLRFIRPELDATLSEYYGWTPKTVEGQIALLDSHTGPKQFRVLVKNKGRARLSDKDMLQLQAGGITTLGQLAALDSFTLTDILNSGKQIGESRLQFLTVDSWQLQKQARVIVQRLEEQGTSHSIE